MSLSQSPKLPKVTVIELFAGVGGFRCGLEKASTKYEIIWSNQWEPPRGNQKTSKQFASEIYVKRFSDKNHSNKDIAAVPAEEIPDFDLLTAGFPCQDYSVARTLNQAEGIKGKKGVLWWQIHRILQEKKRKANYALLENVDRLLKSPAKQRGKDFAIMLASLSDLGYVVEWRIINAADYDMPQRRRRVYFLAYKRGSRVHDKVIALQDPEHWIKKIGIFAKAFKIKADEIKTRTFSIEGSLPDISEKFNKGAKKSPFENCGIMIGRKVWTLKAEPDYDGPRALLKDIILPEEEVPEEFFIKEEDKSKWEYFKGSKKEIRIHKDSGTKYEYAEGKMVFPDSLDSPSRTIVTGEGGASASRFKHIIRAKSGRLRRLTPIELERLNMFPDNHTNGTSDINRAFLMGNALVVGVITKIGDYLIKEMNY